MSSVLTLRRPGLLLTRAFTSQPSEREKEVASVNPSRALLHFEDLPIWYQDNPYVRTYYRPVSNSSFSCVGSWTYLHNETGNIYTHLVPAVLSVFGQYFMQRALNTHFQHITIEERLLFALNLLAATTTFTLSTFYHTLMNHSFAVSSLWLRIDYIGILTLILGSFFSGIYVGFYEHPHLRAVYFAMITMLSLITSVLVLHPSLQGLKFRTHRTLAFILTGLSGFAPITHGLWLYGWKLMWERSGMPFWLAEGAIYGVGATVFMRRWPEKRWTGKCDILGTSHQIFHVLVLGGAVVHLWGVWSAFAGWYVRSGRGLA